ncbi:thioredoxin-dependent thiol peroxidase [Campylobacter sp. MIT 12-8780]|uniref:thioredoxin-dependent thiol peroxidase n=1 Tax=unclassified Campylobacter TaxID=2593542 RepID=UPI00115DC270|nr:MULTISPECIES: thioredoxin-dependent thiol peroxidase [unclassified Campylobacter]NDJ27361.1 thioredoxin-dependent thiol peroxidase [Campylobacter sp. MIT 19-121]TQR40247.1 thioredoxin-dependent thiol peroxidase [Campylobacter sp. MIT 12-8780]
MSELKLGDKAPEFSLVNQDGTEISLKDFSGKKVVLYFYPKDNTPGCTTEACEFSELLGNFEDKNAVIIGISPDNPKSHENFVSKFKLKHILLCDEDKSAAKAYGAWGLKKNYGKEYEGIIRSTFVIDEQGKILAIYKNVRAKDHAAKVLADLAKA